MSEFKGTPWPWIKGSYSGHYDQSPSCREGETLLGVGPIETNGPWKGHAVHYTTIYDNSHEVSSATTFETVCGNYGYEEGGVISECDRSLIVAAPELLYALQYVLRTDDSKFRLSDDDWTLARGAARAAIAKALGEQP